MEKIVLASSMIMNDNLYISIRKLVEEGSRIMIHFYKEDSRIIIEGRFLEGYIYSNGENFWQNSFKKAMIENRFTSEQLTEEIDVMLGLMPTNKEQVLNGHKILYPVKNPTKTMNDSILFQFTHHEALDYINELQQIIIRMEEMKEKSLEVM